MSYEDNFGFQTLKLGISFVAKLFILFTLSLVLECELHEGRILCLFCLALQPLCLTKQHLARMGVGWGVLHNVF